MTAYPAQLTQRFAREFRELKARITKLETRTGSIDSGANLAALPATIDPDYTGPGDPMCLIGDTAPSLTGPYNYLSSYTPVANDTVLVLPMPATQSQVTSYIILGAIS
jgi:hypothetical protein